MNNNRNRNPRFGQDGFRNPKSNAPQMNETLPRFVVLIDETGANLGEMSKADALRKAAEKQLDAVVISPNAKVPIAKLMDYGRWQYEQKRKKRESKKKQTIIKIKEISVKPTIGQHDLAWRANNAKNWLSDGCHVKFTVQTYNRLISREDIINGIFNTFIGLIGEQGEVEKPFSRVAANSYEAIIVPNKNYRPKQTPPQGQNPEQR